MTTDLDLSPTTAADETVRPLFRAEHEELRATARAFVAREIVPNVEEWERAEDVPRELFRRVGDAGFLGLKFDGTVGGSGPDLLAAAVWTEELARCLSGGVAADLGASTDLAALYVDRSGTDELRQRYVRPTVAGETIGALAITEPGAGSDVAGISTRARRDVGGWVLDGEKVFITNGAWCDWVVVAAKVSPEDGAPSGDPHGQITLFAVDADAPGFSRRRMGMLGWRTSHTGELRFDGVRIGDDQRIGEVGSGFAQITRAFAWERLSMSLGAVSAAERTLEIAIAFAKEREAFGRPVASFQVWRHRFADLNTRIATGRALTHQALRLVVAQDEEGADAPDSGVVLRTVAMAKLVTQRLAFDVADECVQVHGGAGYMMEYPAQRAWRDARLGPIGGGTDEIMKEIIAKTYGL
jgi:alkylation response protein AidB-like acyl-CoA dehydrogenase